MQITIVKVGLVETIPTDKGRSYNKVEVLYRNERGEVQTKNLISFKNPGVFKEIQSAKEGDVFDVKSTKNDKGYFDWVSVSKSNGNTDNGTEVQAVAVQESAAKPTTVYGEKTTGKVTGSNYETPAERAARQVWIVRQSSISNATNILTANAGISGQPYTVGDVTAVAAALEQWVFRSDNPFNAQVAQKAADPVAVVVTPPKPRGRPKATAVEPVATTTVE